MEEARQQALTAMEHRPDLPQAFRLMGHIAFAEGDLEAAENLYRIAISKGDATAELQNNLGIILAEQGDITAEVYLCPHCSFSFDGSRHQNHHCYHNHNLSVTLTAHLPPPLTLARILALCSLRTHARTHPSPPTCVCSCIGCG